MTDNFNIPSFCCIFVLTHNVHRNKKCSVLDICLLSERHDFCDFDIGCSSVPTNFVKHRTRFYLIIKRKPNINVLTRGWVMQFPTSLWGWVSHFCTEGRGWAITFLSTTFPNDLAHPPPPHPLFLEGDEGMHCSIFLWPFVLDNCLKYPLFSVAKKY